MKLDSIRSDSNRMHECFFAKRCTLEVSDRLIGTGSSVGTTHRYVGRLAQARQGDLAGQRYRLARRERSQPLSGDGSPLSSASSGLFELRDI